jgi:V/A-type H+-transporting ATPase subunit C
MGEYDYANARIRALTSRLFDRRDYHELTAISRLDDLIARLARSHYAREIENVLARYPDQRVVSEACRLHEAKTYRRIRGFFDNDGARLVSVLLARWDLHNLKTILRGQESGFGPEEILDLLVPAGDLDEGALRSLVRQPTPAATADLLRTWNVGYAKVVQAALAELTETRDRIAFEVSLDTLFYERLMVVLDAGKMNDRLALLYLAREIDTINALTALRLRLERSNGFDRDAKRFFLRGGTTSRDWLMKLASFARDEEALAMLRASKFGKAVTEVESDDIVRMQGALERDLARFAITLFYRDPLSIATAIGFIAAKKVEASNLRLIAHGIAVGAGRARIENDLVLL